MGNSAMITKYPTMRIICERIIRAYAPPLRLVIASKIPINPDKAPDAPMPIPYPP